MRLRCPNCGEVASRVTGHYEIVATSDLRFTHDREVIKPAVAPLEVSTRSLTIRQVTCRGCGHTGPLETWTIVVHCVGCGDPLAEFQTALVIPAAELYCEREGSFLCGSCLTRYDACGVCRSSSTCPIFNREE